MEWDLVPKNLPDDFSTTLQQKSMDGIVPFVKLQRVCPAAICAQTGLNVRIVCKKKKGGNFQTVLSKESNIVISIHPCPPSQVYPGVTLFRAVPSLTLC